MEVEKGKEKEKKKGSTPHVRGVRMFLAKLSLDQQLIDVAVGYFYARYASFFHSLLD